MHMGTSQPMKLFIDNVSTINLAKNPILHGRSKHIETRFHFLRDQVNKRKVELVHVRSEDQIVDILTKPLRTDRFFKFRSLLGLVPVKSLD